MITRELAGGLTVWFRDAVPGDQRFVMSTWLRHHREHGDWPGRLPTNRCPHETPCGCCRFTHRRYFDEHARVIEALLARSTTTVACNPERPDQVLGYVVAQPNAGTLHWIFVKPTFRWDREATEHPRVGTALLEEAFGTTAPVDNVACSHWTKQAGHLARKWGLVYDPFALEGIA